MHAHPRASAGHPDGNHHPTDPNRFANKPGSANGSARGANTSSPDGRGGGAGLP